MVRLAAPRTGSYGSTGGTLFLLQHGFYNVALAAIGGFDPIFRQAGDAWNICLALQQRAQN